MQVRLIPALNAACETTFSLDDESPLVIGRASNCDLRLGNPRVSRRHCELVATHGELHVRDLDSSNGTYVNDQRVEGELVVSTGDSLWIGSTVFRIEVLASETGRAAPAAPSAAAPAWQQEWPATSSEYAGR